MTEPSAIATGPSGNRNPLAITRISATARSSGFTPDQLWGFCCPSPCRVKALNGSDPRGAQVAENGRRLISGRMPADYVAAALVVGGDNSG
jgi:hypothetical protein